MRQCACLRAPTCWGGRGLNFIVGTQGSDLSTAGCTGKQPAVLRGPILCHTLMPSSMPRIPGPVPFPGAPVIGPQRCYRHEHPLEGCQPGSCAAELHAALPDPACLDRRVWRAQRLTQGTTGRPAPPGPSHVCWGSAVPNGRASGAVQRAHLRQICRAAHSNSRFECVRQRVKKAARDAAELGCTRWLALLQICAPPRAAIAN